ncbi:MAG: fatty acid desaturase, partial [Hyphomicrobiales bacterium]|nr:fatty acid desaturase [Hyphomicrobiales bacterium]
KISLAFFGLPQAKVYFSRLVPHAVGRLSEEEKTFIPEMERHKVTWIARMHIAIYAVVIILAIATGSILPLMYVGLPSLYGAWLYVLTGLTQHAGLVEDVLDHRLNCRTVYMNPLVRFSYWNMNYHIEHHMFPMIPYHNLPALHEEIRADTPTPYGGFWEAYKEIIPTLIRQVKEPTYYAKRELPPTARSFSPPTAVPAAAAE